MICADRCELIYKLTNKFWGYLTYQCARKVGDLTFVVVTGVVNVKLNGRSRGDLGCVYNSS